MVKYLTITLL